MRPNAEDWTHARRLAETDAGPGEWDAFDGAGGADDVWLAVTSPNTVLGVQCGDEQGPSSAFLQADSGSLKGRRGVAGQCDGALRLQPEPLSGSGWFGATIYLVCAARRGDADVLLDAALARGPRPLLESHRTYWRDFVGRAGLAGDPVALGAMRRALLTIAAATERESGLVVWAPAAHPPLAWASPRQTAWAALALDEAGLQQRAGRALSACLGHRHGDGGTAPPGALPAAIHADGVAAAPEFVLDPAGTAWLLGGCWRHAEVLPFAERRAFLGEIREHIVPCGDFLAAWSDGPGGGPLPGFNAAHLRDMPSDELPVALYMGLTAARNLVAAFGEQPPEHWEPRRRALLSHLQLRLVREADALRLAPETPYYLRGVIEGAREDRWDLWDAPVQTGDGPISLGEAPFPRELPGGAAPVRHTWAAAMRFIGLRLGAPE